MEPTALRSRRGIFYLPVSHFDHQRVIPDIADSINGLHARTVRGVEPVGPVIIQLEKIAAGLQAVDSGKGVVVSQAPGVFLGWRLVFNIIDIFHPDLCLSPVILVPPQHLACFFLYVFITRRAILFSSERSFLSAITALPRHQESPSKERGIFSGNMFSVERVSEEELQ